MKKIILSIFLLGSVASVATAAYTGHIYVDSNNNGTFDKGEKTLPGVLVSDGLNVVKTANDGSFTLPGHAKESFIFVTIPSGYKVRDKHYYCINSERKIYDFALQPYDAGIKPDGSHKYVQITDTEISGVDNHDEWVNNVRDYAAGEQAAFIIHTGDICYEKGLKSHVKLMNTNNMGRPMFYCNGNHDLVDGKYGEELFESIYGPTYYSFDVGSTHYIVTPMLVGDRKPRYTKEDVYRWLKNDLAQIPQGKPIVIFSHDLVIENERLIYGINNKERIDLHAHNLKAWVYGHWHINYMRKWGDAFAAVTSPPDKAGIDHSANAFRVMHVDGKGDFKSELRYTYLNKEMQVTSPTKEQVPVLASGAVPLVVNVYSSASPVKEVTYTCWVDNKELFSEKKLRQATDWCWNGEVPLTSREKGKKITLKLKACFDNGDVIDRKTVFTYHPAHPEVKLTGNWENLLGNPQHVAIAGLASAHPLQMAWIKNIDANIYMTSPLVHNGKVYIASVDENLKGEAYVYCLGGKDGRLIWKYQTRNSVKNTIAINNGQVLAQDAQGYLYAINAENGKLNWEKQLVIKNPTSLIEGLVASGGIVYAGTGKGLCAINVENGNVIWQNKDWQSSMGATSTLTVGDHILIASSQWGALYAHDNKTGKLKWKASANGLRSRGASAAIHGDWLYVISEKSLFIMGVDNGEIIERKDLPFRVDVTSTPLVTDKEIIFGSVKDGLVALDKKTLEMKWNFKTDNALIFSAPYSRKPSATIETSPVLVGNTVYVGASDGTIYGLNKKNGQPVWRHKTGAPIFGSIAISGNALIVADFGGNVYAFVSKK